MKLSLSISVSKRDSEAVSFPLSNSSLLLLLLRLFLLPLFNIVCCCCLLERLRRWRWRRRRHFCLSRLTIGDDWHYGSTTVTTSATKIDERLVILSRYQNRDEMIHASTTVSLQKASAALGKADLSHQHGDAAQMRLFQK